MSYRDVLVHVKFYESWSQHIEVAGRVSHAFGARLTALYTLRDIATLKVVFGAESPTVQARQAKDALALEKAEKGFRRFVKQTGIDGDWKVGEGTASELLTWAGRFHDLVVVEQTDNVSDEIGFDVAEQCVLASGRPTLVVPYRGHFPTVGRRILVAWNGSREAALAVHGALPLIAKAERVDLLLGRGKETFNSITRYPDLKITDYLQRHAPCVEARRFDVSDAEAGTAILDEARKAEADLLVMGAYGRWWFSEWILGGATQHVLRDMHLPVLMAH
ncbi:MAG: universal stress protein [Alphaproteobacteria bacterium]|nr:universal stress protein [Alphaproteobacteria bacterium]MBM3733294.1 universal stress protein [Acidimicrobiia bacterium]MBM3950034.1 universal stress protein [Rhodospirillales bacterium]